MTRAVFVVVVLGLAGCGSREAPAPAPASQAAPAAAASQPASAPARAAVPSAPAAARAAAPPAAARARPAPGCTANLKKDPLNCGACGRVCPSAERTLPVCVRGECRQVCRVGYGDCDNDPATVCETEVLRDPCNCARCGRRCPTGTFCVAGMCQGRQDPLVRTGPRAPTSCVGWRLPAGGR